MDGTVEADIATKAATGEVSVVAPPGVSRVVTEERYKVLDMVMVG